VDERRSPVIEDDPVRVAAERAAGVLGWPGVVLPEVTVFGCRFLPVVVLDVAVHEVRQRDGDGPQLDGDVLAMWEWPESPSPASVARLSGGLFRMCGRFSAAVSQAREWRPFGPAAVLAPAAVVAEEVNRWECALHGVGLVSAAPVGDPTSNGGPEAEHVLAEAGRRAPARRRTADRWIEETLYALAVDTGVLTS
jgi:hypothetical protein